MRWYLKVLRKYAVFRGRAPRREFWFFMFFQLLAVVLISFLERQFAIANPEIYMGKVTGFYLLATLLPTLAVTVRRLHDCSLSGWWVLLGLVPFIGGIILCVLAAMPGSRSGRHSHRLSESEI